ncbi:hypothetical protein [Bifidobacterium avesanii]|uniref:hypothetical protein n=1 Tax=Bifidobacterium avesanii TaxID=1798157 RepID=UPI00137E110A|nr:hypothetical protein [Bifidobacterium avesanii]KAB8294535.1 hypothetical protein DSM100685_0328 [Bifidobacterium avesanii]
MDYDKVRRRLDVVAEGRASDRQLLAVIAGALVDLAESQAHIAALLERMTDERGQA